MANFALGFATGWIVTALAIVGTVWFLSRVAP